MVVPNTFFCTFMEGVGQQTATEMEFFECDGHKLKFIQAKSPSDTLWLSRGVSKKSQCGRFLFAITIIAFCVFLVFLLFSLEVGLKIFINYRANPPNIVCSEVEESYNPQQILSMATLEYYYLQFNDNGIRDLVNKVSETGALPCFCMNAAE